MCEGEGERVELIDEEWWWWRAGGRSQVRQPEVEPAVSPAPCLT